MTLAIRILGIDPGLNATGWGVIEQAGTRLSAIAWGVIKAPAKAPMAERLRYIHEAVEALIAAHAPARAGLPVAEYAPRLVKKSVVGTGAADKGQIAAMIAVLLPGTKAEADAADALAIAICHAHHRSARARLAS